MPKMLKNSKRWNLWGILDFKCLYVLEKYSTIFQNFLIKSLIHKIKDIKISRICWQVQIDEIKNKMSQIMKKIKKQIVNSRILKTTIISHINIFFKRTFRIFEKSLVKSLTFPIKHYKKFHHFWTSFDRWNRKQNAKNPKKIKKK